MKVAAALQLAEAVSAGSRARYLRPDNSAGARVELAAAVASGQAYFVHPHPRLLVVDIDLPTDPTTSADRLAAGDLLLDAAARAGVPAVAVPSGRPGHQHVYLVTGAGPARSRLETWCRERGLDVRNRGIRPPGAPHRCGLPLPAPPERALAVLSVDPDPAATSRLAAALCPLVLPPRIQLAVRYGAARAGYESPSHARMSLAVAVHARGGSMRLLEQILTDPRSPLGATYRAKPARWQAAELGRLWAKAAVFVASGTRTSSHPHLRAVASAATRARWAGAGGGSDLAVLEELIRIGWRAHAHIICAALDDLAIGAGVSRDTARAALRRLTAAGWVHQVAQESARTARSYELTIPAPAAGDDAHEEPASGALPVPAAGAFGDLGADVARWGALGKATMRVARAAAEHPGASVHTLAALLVSSVAAVRHHLRKLTAAGLVEHNDGVVQLADVDVSTLQVLAHAFGTGGARAAACAALTAYRALRARVRTQLRPRSGAGGGPATT